MVQCGRGKRSPFALSRYKDPPCSHGASSRWCGVVVPVVVHHLTMVHCGPSPKALGPEQCDVNIQSINQPMVQCQFIHWAPWAWGPDKLDLTKCSGYKFRSTSAKGVHRSSVPSA
ncbi:hypothetical protein TNCV_3238861 [Trichonephila clavipes]|nr:hypothetical protein TNCV_3238861 [Trichonephila clavipes]